MTANNQMTLFDFIAPVNSPTVYFELGKWTDELKAHKGKQIKFADLKNYVGKQILYESCNREDRFSYKVILLTSFHEDCRPVYIYQGDKLVNEYLYDVCYPEEKKRECKEIGKESRIGYADRRNGKGKENAWVSEQYCLGGRYDKYIRNSTAAFYELV